MLATYCFEARHTQVVQQMLHNRLIVSEFAVAVLVNIICRDINGKAQIPLGQSRHDMS